jgi:hypothetical protein
MLRHKFSADHQFDDAAARIAGEDGVGIGSTALELDTMDAYVRTSAGWAQIVSAGVEQASGLAGQAVALTAASTYNTTEIKGLLVTASGSASWTLVFKNGGSMTVPQTALLVGTVYPFNLSSITSGAGGTAVLFI